MAGVGVGPRPLVVSCLGAGQGVGTVGADVGGGQRIGSASVSVTIVNSMLSIFSRRGAGRRWSRPAQRTSGVPVRAPGNVTSAA
jgi:hypothetical protein